jgi:cytochrome c oxidase subunit IV
MTTAPETATHDEHAEHHDEEHEHISDWGYVKVALLLAAITALEVFTYFESVANWGKILIPALLVMMVIKFGVVVAFFMHLKFDSPVFTRVFVAGLLFALGVYLAMILAFGFHPWEVFQE